MSEPGAIRLVQHIAYPPERVWEAITQPAFVQRWWASGDIRPEVGHRFTLDMGGFGKQTCEVIEAEPPSRFSYTFGEGMLDTVITWALEPEGEGTRLTFEHSGFNLETEMGQRALQGMSGGWPGILAGIEPAMDA